MKHFTITFALLALFSIIARAQGFDWVQAYSGYWEPQDYPSNYIVGSVTDSHGNLYVAGQMVFSAVFAGEDILPFTPMGSDVMLGACILKLSPTGELLWKKALHAKEYHSFIHGIQLVGDTALWVCAETSIPEAEDDYLYFYDTLVTPSTRQFLMDDDEHSSGAAMVVTAFDLDGNRMENYFLHLAYKDMEGRMITWRMMNGISSGLDFVVKTPLFSGTFHVDNQGNIYLGHIVKDRLYMACDTCSGAQEATLGNGLLSEVVVMVNGQPRFTDTNTAHPTFSNYRIMKFSPHFDSMLACRYVFENEIGQWAYYINQQLITDTSGNHLYLMFNIDEPSELADQQITGSADKVVRFTSWIQGVVVEYDSLLQPLEVYQIEQVQPLSGQAEWISSFCKMVIDTDSNLLFILGNMDNNPEIDLTVNGQPVELGDAGNAFFLKTRVGNPTILADGFARSDHATSLWGAMDPKGAVASKGRLYAMVVYAHNIQWRDTSITLPRAPNGAYNEGEGVFIWSYDGDELDFIDLKKCSTANPVSSSLALHDSTLYICGGMTDDIRMADTVIHPATYSIAYIARYDLSGHIDTTHTDPIDAGIEDISILNSQFSIYPNPTTGRVTITSTENIVSATLTDMMGRREEVRLTATASGQYTLDITSRSQTTYLLSLTTADGRTHSFKLLKQPSTLK